MVYYQPTEVYYGIEIINDVFVLQKVWCYVNGSAIDWWSDHCLVTDDVLTD